MTNEILVPLSDGKKGFADIDCRIYRSPCNERDILCDRRVLSCVPPDETKELLLKKLEKYRKKTVGFGFTSLCYPPDEKVLRLTESALETIYDAGNPVWIETKSTVILRDTGLISMIARKNGATVTVPVFTDDGMSPVFEKNTPLPSERFEMISRLSAAGIRCGVICAPVIAYLTDSRRKMIRIAEQSAEAGAQFIVRDMGLFLTEKFKPAFFSAVEEYFPGFSALYDNFNGNYLSIPRRRFIEEAFDGACMNTGLKIIERS